MKLAILGIDLAKSVFHLHGADARGRMLLRKRLSRAQLLPFIGNLPRCVVAMEAGGLRRRPSLGPRSDAAGPYGAAHQSAVRQSLRQEQQK
jgi:hypothetical protein